MPKVACEQRDYDRFPIDFVVDVYQQQSDACFKWIETADLRDAAEGGFSFVSNRKNVYKVGDFLHLTITIPGIKDVLSRMEGNAHVVRCMPGEGGAASIGVRLDDVMNFKWCSHA